MIVEVKDYYILWKISRLIDKGVFKDIGYTADEFFVYLRDKWDDERIKVFAYIDNGEIKGFAVCSLVRGMVRKVPQVFIDLAYIKKGEPKIGDKIVERIEKYAKELKVNEITGYSQRGERAIFRKYKFDLDYTVYTKKLERQKDS